MSDDLQMYRRWLADAKRVNRRAKGGAVTMLGCSHVAVHQLIVSLEQEKRALRKRLARFQALAAME